MKSRLRGGKVHNHTCKFILGALLQRTLNLTTGQPILGLNKLYVTLNYFWYEGAALSYSTDIFLIDFPSK